VVVSVLAETLVLVISGAAPGAIAAWIAFNGDLHSAGDLVFRLAVTPSLVGLGIAFAYPLGFVGGRFPAIRAASLPAADALRATFRGLSERKLMYYLTGLGQDVQINVRHAAKKQGQGVCRLYFSDLYTQTAAFRESHVRQDRFREHLRGQGAHPDTRTPIEHPRV
jgi:hypothetical protein